MPSSTDPSADDGLPPRHDPPDEGAPDDDSSPWAGVGRRWDEVGSALNGLAEEFRHRYRGAGEAADPRLRDALDRAGQAFSDAMAALGRTIDDPEVRDRAVRSASAFGSAVASTLDALGEQVQQKVNPRQAGDGHSEAPRPADGEPTA
jgi:hypothetical protein